MTEKDIQKILVQQLDVRKFPFQMCNCFIYKWECDFWTLDTKGFTREFEIKISLQDFYKDGEKPKHQKPTTGANYFYYVCPYGLIPPELISKGYGLIYINKFEYCEIIKKPAKLHDRIFDNYKMLAEKYMWKWFDLWKRLYIDKQIDYNQYKEGFNNGLTD